MDEQYKVQLGVDVKVDDIKTQINGVKIDPIPIKVEIENLDDIKRQLQNLGSTKSKTKVDIIDTSLVEKSLSEVSSAIKNIKSAVGTLDSKKGMTSLLTTVNKISKALTSVSKQFVSLNKSLSALSGKDLSFNFNLKMGNANPIKAMTDYGQTARRETIPALQEQVTYLKRLLGGTDEADKALERYLVKLHKGFEGVSAKKRLEGEMVGIGSDGKQISDIKRMSAYETYVGYLKEIASLNGVNLDSFNAKFSKAAAEMVDDTVKIQSGVKETEEQFERLKNIFGSGISSEQLDSIVKDLGEIKNSLKSLSEGISVDEITKSFKEMSVVLADITDNLTIFRNAFGNTGNGLSSSVASTTQGLKDSANVLDTFKRSLQNVGMGADEIDVVANRIKSLGVQIETLNQKKLTIAGVTDENGAKKSLDKEILSVDISGIDKLGNAVKLTQQYDVATGKLIQSIDKVSTVHQKAGASTNNFAKQQKNAVSNLTNQINQLNRAANDQNAPRAIKDVAHLETLTTKYNEVVAAIQRVEAASSDTFVDEQNNVKKLISEYKSLVSEYRNAENVSTNMRAVDFESGLDIAKNNLKKFKAEAKDFPQITTTVKELDKAIESVGDASSLNQFNDQLRVARSELAKVKSETVAANRNDKVGINVSGLESKIADIQRISPEINKFETEIDGAKVSVQSLLNDLKQIKTQGDFSVVNSRFKAFADAAKAAGIAVTEVATKVKSVKDIKLDIELGAYDNQISQMDDKFNRLSSASVELRESVEQVHRAYKQMEEALESTGDEVADKKRLIQAEKEYAAALEKTNNLIRIQARTDKTNADKDKLDYDIKLFQSEIDSWLIKNSAATKRFGDTMLDLKARAENVDRVTLNGLISQFKLADKEAEKLGLKTQSTFDKLKTKFKEYMTYLSAAELFMWAEQGLRSMFEQVKLIDSAMTELKKVTNETDAAYEKFLTNAATRSKEIGTTIDGLVSSTADFARLGYGFEDAQGLAEVANIYAVVGDEIEGVEGATESLISTMAAFKDEMNGMSNSDFAMSIIDKFNEIGNNFAISSGGIGEALERSASSLMAANNTIDESIALITAANTVVGFVPPNIVIY